MAEISAVNGQVTDAVSQSGVTVLAEAPAMGLASAYQSGAHAVGLAMQNAIANQRQATTQSRTVATQAVAQVLTLAPSVSARATQETLDGHAWMQNLLGCLAVAHALRRERRANEAAGEPVEREALPPDGIIGPTVGPAPVPAPVPAPAAGPDANLAPLIAAVRALAAGIAALADTPKGKTTMHDLDALETIRRAAERVVQALEVLAQELVDSKAATLCEDLRKASEDLREATRRLEARPQVPVGASPVGASPGVFIVGSGNTQVLPHRIVGATY
jgi:hypothetical protein